MSVDERRAAAATAAAVMAAAVVAAICAHGRLATTAAAATAIAEQFARASPRIIGSLNRPYARARRCSGKKAECSAAAQRRRQEAGVCDMQAKCSPHGGDLTIGKRRAIVDRLHQTIANHEAQIATGPSEAAAHSRRNQTRVRPTKRGAARDKSWRAALIANAYSSGRL